jgi:hypothetical protein
MVGQIFSSVEFMSSVVVGGATLGAAGINLLREGRNAKRTARETGEMRRWLWRPLVLLLMSVAGVGLWFGYTAGAFERLGIRAPAFARARLETSRAAAQSTPRDVDPARASSPAALAAAVVPSGSGKLEDWLQSEGTKLYYRFSRYLPDACPGNPIAIGNWADGEAQPITATCVDQDWLAFDVAPLVADGRITPNLTYCMNFRSESGAWGVHVPERAPGLDSVVVPAVRVPLGRAIGLRYLQGLRERIVPTSEPPRADC